jgi:hypothetical protein
MDIKAEILYQNLLLENQRILKVRVVGILILILLATSRLTSDEVRDKFTSFYRHCEWGADRNGKGTSGYGSTFETARLYIKYINKFIKDNNVKSIIEIGCGDGVLLKYLNVPQGVSYTGYDVVESILKKNRKKFPNYTFANLNILEEDFPNVDLILCKDVLQHLPNQMVIEMFEKIKTHCQWSLITNDYSSLDNQYNFDILIGACRNLDFEKPPFEFSGKYVYEYKAKGCLKKIFLFTHQKSS